MTARKLTTVSAVVGLLVLGGSAVPVFAADNGSVNAQVIASSGACILVTAGTSGSVDFGTANFQATGVQNVTVGTPNVDVRSCASSSQTILGRGTNATGGDGASWSLTTDAACSSAGTTNQYNLGLRPSSGADTYLSTTDASLGSLAASASLNRTPIMRMPCTGSTGAGQTMSMQYVFTATIP